MADDHPLLGLETAVLIAIGGFAGSNLRYFVSLALPGRPGTLLVNLVGSFVLAFVLYEALYSGLLGRRTHVVVGTGFLSSFTTYSTFVLESATAPSLWPLANVVATYALGFAAVLAGRALAVAVDRRWT